MKTKSLIIAGMGSLAIMALSCNTFANPMRMGGQRGPAAKHCCCAKKGHMRFYKHLTDTQKASLKKIKMDTRKQMMPLMQSLRAKKAMLKAVLLQPNIDEQKINQLVGEVSALNSKMLAVHVATFIRIRKEVGVIPPMHRFGRHHMRG